MRRRCRLDEVRPSSRSSRAIWPSTSGSSGDVAPDGGALGQPHLVVVARPTTTGSRSTSGRARRLRSSACAQRRPRAPRAGARRRARSSAAAAARGRRASRAATSPAASCASTASQSPVTVGGQPVGPRGEQLVAEQVAQPVELGAQGRGAAVVLVEQHGQLVAGEPARRRGEQQQDLAVPRAEPQRLTPCRGRRRCVSSDSVRPSDSRTQRAAARRGVGSGAGREQRRAPARPRPSAPRRAPSPSSAARRSRRRR